MFKSRNKNVQTKMSVQHIREMHSMIVETFQAGPPGGTSFVIYYTLYCHFNKKISFLVLIDTPLTTKLLY